MAAQTTQNRNCNKFLIMLFQQCKIAAQMNNCKTLFVHKPNHV